MSVIIKGMDMPETCYECQFSQPIDNAGGTTPCCAITGEYCNFFAIRPDSCPLIELPKNDWCDAKAPPYKGERVFACTHDGWQFIGKDFTVGDEINDTPDGVGWWRFLPFPPSELLKG